MRTSAARPDRRAHPRHDIRLAAEITAGRTFTAVTRDLSASGCCVQSAYALTEGAEIGVSLFLVVDGVEEEGMPALALRAQVQWTADSDEAPIEERHLAGLRFEGVTESQSAWLERVLGRSAAG